MKLTTQFSAIALGLATVSVAVGQPHRHQHRHVKRDEVDTPVSTVIAYVLNGTPIPAHKVCDGIANGSLKWKGGLAPKGACSPQETMAEVPTTTAATASTQTEGAQFYQKSSSSSSESTSSAAATSAAPTQSSTQSSYGSSGSGGNGADSDFPDGELDCSHFPSDYGAVSVAWLGLGGWSGVQYVTISGGQVTNIDTAISGQSCTGDSAMCSYACPPGYQKSQWPSTQGSTGQSVGGLSCKGGKLHLTNPGLSSKLCIQGTGNVQVHNELDEGVAVCRTDYPGTESETVPLSVAPGQIEDLTCPDAGSYFSWKGMSTSAQYYVNPKGVSVSDGCQWGSSSNPWGNFAPINLGVGTKDGATWIAILANKPTTNVPLDFDIEIVGDNLGGSCKYSNGVFTSATGSNGDGCTVQVMSGTATYVFS